MTSGGKNYCFKENDRCYVFYDKEGFYNTVKRLLFVSRSESLNALADSLGISFDDMINEIEKYSIPVDWILRMGFKFYEMIKAFHSDMLQSGISSCLRFNEGYANFIGQLSADDKKKLAKSMEKALLFPTPLLIDETTRKYLDSLSAFINNLTRDC